MRTKAPRPWYLLPARSGAVLAVLLTGMLVVTAACGGDSATTVQPAAEPVVTLDPALQAEAVAARDRGADYLVQRFDLIDPLHLSGLGYLHRRWGIDALSGAAEAGRSRLEQVRASSATVSRASGGSSGDNIGVSVDPVEILALQRFVDPEATEVPDRARLAEAAALLADGLYCDVAPLDEEDLDRWDALTELGGYEATHVVLAWFVSSEVGCDDPAITAAGQRAADRVAADLTVRLEAGITPGDVDDLLIEQAAFLERVGRGDVLTPTLIEALVDAQLPDGGWPRNVGDTTSDWHATALAVWTLSAATTPSGEARWVEA